MGDRRSFGGPYMPGRSSPFSSTFNDARNISNHFEYVTDDYEPLGRAAGRPSVSVPDYPELDDNDPNAPDRVHWRYMGQPYIVDFPAYSINEGRACVGDLRERIARQLRVEPSKVQLIYKGHKLRQNQSSLKSHKMKQNSEVSVVVTERGVDYDGAVDSNSESGSDRDASQYLSANNRRRPRAPSSVRLRSDENIPIAEPGSRSSFLNPNGHIPASPMDRQHRDSLRPDYVPSRDDRYRGREREPSRDPARRQREPSPAPRRAHSPAPPRPTPPPADPNTPLGKVQALASTFRTQWLPSAVRFIASPPADAAVREKEFLRLSESIMAKIVLAADNIETEGNVDARNERKAMITEAQQVLKQLDQARNA